MRIIVLVLLALLLTATTADAALTKDQAVALAEKLDYNGIIIVMDPEGVQSLNGGAGYWMGFIPFVVIAQPKHVPDSWAVFVLFHELAHHRFWEHNVAHMPPYGEWEADVWAIKRMCDMGMRPEPAYDALESFIGGKTDEEHGDPRLRQTYAIAQTWSYCSPTPVRVESP